MKPILRCAALLVGSLCLFSNRVPASEGLEKDLIKTSAGDLEITFIGHGSLMMRWGGKVIHIDPMGGLTDYGKLPPANLLLITHQHGDHCDVGTIEQLRSPKTVILMPAVCSGQVSDGTVIGNGESRTVMGIPVEAVPAYNLVQKRPDGKPFHPKGEGNGYVLTFGKTRVYVAGDTENTPEMKALKNIDVAFLPMNLPYTMTPDMVADAAKEFRPKILYPYHFGETDTAALRALLKDTRGIDVRIRNMK